MTGIAYSGSTNMADTTRTGLTAVVTGNAIPGEVGVIRNSQYCPGIYAMAGITLQRRDDMIRSLATS
jgi:hypothetical protein